MLASILRGHKIQGEPAEKFRSAGVQLARRHPRLSEAQEFLATYDELEEEDESCS